MRNRRKNQMTDERINKTDDKYNVSSKLGKAFYITYWILSSCAMVVNHICNQYTHDFIDNF